MEIHRTQPRGGEHLDGKDHEGHHHQEVGLQGRQVPCECGILVKIWRTRVLQESVSGVPEGWATRLPDGRVVASCGSGALELVEVQPEGRRRQSGADWFNGLRAAGPVVLS